MGEARRRKDRGEYPARTKDRPARTARKRRRGAWLGRTVNGTLRFPDGTRYKMVGEHGGLRRMTLTSDGRWIVRPAAVGSARQRRRAKTAARRAS